MTETRRRESPRTVSHRTAAAVAFAFAAATLLASAPAPSGASTATPSPEHAIDRGALLYRIHCANCHGDGGEGDGPMAEVLTERPTDLTHLPRTAEGGFPADEVRAAIDGREALPSHGRQEMPVWGLTFQQRGRDTDQEAEVRGRIDDLIAFLRSIQERPADGETEHGEEDHRSAPSPGVSSGFPGRCSTPFSPDGLPSLQRWPCPSAVSAATEPPSGSGCRRPTIYGTRNGSSEQR